MIALLVSVLAFGGLAQPAWAATLQPTYSTPIRVQESSADLTYSGSWTKMTGGDSGGAIKYLNSTGYVQFKFTGTAFRWLSRTGATSGIANVYLDGKLLAAVDRYSSTTKYQVPVFTKTGLPDTVHTVKVSYTGKKNAKATGANLIIDAFELGKETPPATPTPTTPPVSSTPTASPSAPTTPAPTATPTTAPVIVPDFTPTGTAPLRV